MTKFTAKIQIGSDSRFADDCIFRIPQDHNVPVVILEAGKKTIGNTTELRYNPDTGAMTVKGLITFPKIDKEISDAATQFNEGELVGIYSPNNPEDCAPKQIRSYLISAINIKDPSVRDLFEKD